MPNLVVGQTYRFTFSTDSGGTMTTLSGSPVVSVYKDASDTQSTTGVTLEVDADSRTGFNRVTIDTSADATFYSGGSDFAIVVTTGTVAGVSIAGMPVEHFSLPTYWTALKETLDSSPKGTVDSTAFAPTATEFEADDITEATADHYLGRIILFTSGAMLGQASDVRDYQLVGGRGHFVVTALTEAAADNVTFRII